MTESPEEINFRRGLRWIIGIVISGAVLASAPIAFAAAQRFATSGSDSTEATEVELEADLAAADLYPGFTGGDLAFIVTNSGEIAAEFDTLRVGSVSTSDPTRCGAENVAVRSIPDFRVVVPAQGKVRVQLDDVVTMLHSAPDGCQGVVFSVNVSVSLSA